MKKPLICLITLAFLVNSLFSAPVQAQELALPALPAPGTMVHLSPAFNPPVLKGIKVHPENPFRFDFVLSSGDLGQDKTPPKGVSLKEESTKLIKYFLASLTTPEKDLWVNLSPYEKDRIVPESFGQTEMGRDLLAQDYLLKQITASLIYPEDEVGKKFWQRVYQEAAEKFGTTQIPVNTFNKVWIVPEKAVIYENAKAGTAYVVESKLKVMLEEDYLALSHGMDARVRGHDKEANALGSQIVREVVIPQLTKEVNEGRNFAQLRQVYHSVILAAWYKKKIKDGILNQAYMDQNKIAGVNLKDPAEKQKIYEQYLQAFKKGVYDYVKEEPDPLTRQVLPRKYFSGGVSNLGANVDIRPVNTQALAAINSKDLAQVSADINPIKMPAAGTDRALISSATIKRLQVLFKKLLYKKPEVTVVGSSHEFYGLDHILTLTNKLVEEILERIDIGRGYQDLVDAYQDEINKDMFARGKVIQTQKAALGKIREIMAASKPDVIGLEQSSVDFEKHLMSGVQFIDTLSEIWETFNIGNAELLYEYEIYLLGPVLYLYRHNELEKIKLEGFDSMELKEEAQRLWEEYVESFAQLYQLHFSLEQNQIILPNKENIARIAGVLKDDPKVHELVRRVSALSGQFNEASLNPRDKYMAEKISRMKGRILFFVGTGHVKGVQVELEKRGKFVEVYAFENDSAMVIADKAQTQDNTDDVAMKATSDQMEKINGAGIYQVATAKESGSGHDLLVVKGLDGKPSLTIQTGYGFKVSSAQFNGKEISEFGGISQMAPWQGRMNKGFMENPQGGAPIDLNDLSDQFIQKLGDHPLHGVVDKLPWEVTGIVQEGENITVTGVFDSRKYPELVSTVGEFTIETTYRLTPQGLEFSHKRKNVGSSPIRLEYGLHPWIKGNSDNVSLQFNAERRVTVNDNGIADGTVLTEPMYDFSTPKPVSSVPMDFAFTDLKADENGIVAVKVVDNDEDITYTYQWKRDEFPFVQIWNGWGGSLSIEPMTSYAGQGAYGVNIKGYETLLMQPGEEREGSLIINVQTDKAQMEIAADAAMTALERLKERLGEPGNDPKAYAKNIADFLWKDIVQGPDRLWIRRPWQKSPIAEQALREALQHAGTSSKDIFKQVLQSPFKSPDFPRLYVMHRLVWQQSDELGLLMLEQTVHHILQAALRFSPGNFHHHGLETLYLHAQLDIAEQVLRERGSSVKRLLESILRGQYKEGKGIEELRTQAEFIALGLIMVQPGYSKKAKLDDEIIVRSLQDDMDLIIKGIALRFEGAQSDIHYLKSSWVREFIIKWQESATGRVKLSNNEEDYFARKVQDFVFSPTYQLLRFMQNEVAGAAVRYDFKYQRALRTIKKRFLIPSKRGADALPEVGVVGEFEINDYTGHHLAAVVDTAYHKSVPEYYALNFDLEGWPTVNIAVRGLAHPLRWFQIRPEVPLTESIADRVVSDAAQKANADVAKGGIDFNSDKMNLETRLDSRPRFHGGKLIGNDKGIQFKVDPAMLRQLQNAPGFTPVIINIQPMTNLKLFLGLADR